MPLTEAISVPLQTLNSQFSLQYFYILARHARGSPYIQSNRLLWCQPWGDFGSLCLAVYP
jgi:hypothetical protein